MAKTRRVAVRHHPATIHRQAARPMKPQLHYQHAISACNHRWRAGTSVIAGLPPSYCPSCHRKLHGNLRVKGPGLVWIW